METAAGTRSPQDTPAALTPEERRAWAQSYVNWTWINAHPEVLEEYRGQYIAIWDQRVILHGTDPHVLRDELKESPYWDRPLLIFRVPTHEEVDGLLVL
jgi:hypothetical protein